MDINPEKEVIYFARTNFRNQERLFGFKRKDRRQHTYVVGKTGTGKTTLIKNMVIQDIMNGSGVCVIDPHGEYVEDLLERIPKERMQDVIYFNPADTDSFVGFNPLELPDPKYKHLIASGLMGIFTKIWANTWSARMEYILNNAILALLDTPNSTLLGITRILVDKDFRQQIVANIKDPVVKAFWVNEYEQWQDKFRNEAIAPIQNKVGQFLSTAMIRNVVGQAKSTISIFDIMNTSKIFLINVSKGRIGEDNAALLGAMFITQLQLSAMERIRIPEEDRLDFYLYVDEFQNFATDSFAGILSEARKYRLNLVIAHQYTGQLVTDTSTKVRDAVFGNVGTMLVFRVGAADAEFLEKEFEPELTPQDLVGLPNHHIYLKLMVDGITSRPFSATTLPPFKVRSSDPQEIVSASRARYGRPREVVEEEIMRWSGMMSGQSSGGGGEGPRPQAPRWPRREGAGAPPYPQGASSQSPRNYDRREPPRRKEDPSILAAMGIEFSAEPVAAGSREARPLPNVQPQPLRDHQVLKEVPRATPPPRESVSLSALKDAPLPPRPKPADHIPHSAPKPKPSSSALNIDDFRKAIAESLKETLPHDDQGKK